MRRILRGVMLFALVGAASYVLFQAGNLTNHDTVRIAAIAMPIGLGLWFFTDFRRPGALYTTMLFFGVAAGCWGHLTLP